MINNRFNVVYHLLGLVKLLFYKLKIKNMEEIKLTGELQTIPRGYPCMTRIYGYVFDEIKKRWIYDKNWYRYLVKREFQNNYT